MGVVSFLLTGIPGNICRNYSFIFISTVHNIAVTGVCVARNGRKEVTPEFALDVAVVIVRGNVGFALPALLQEFGHSNAKSGHDVMLFYCFNND